MTIFHRCGTIDVESEGAMRCEGSGKKRHVSDYDVINKKSRCEYCGKKVRITIPNSGLHCNVAKFSKHKKD